MAPGNYLPLVSILQPIQVLLTMGVLTGIICMYSLDLIGLGFIQKVSNLLRSEEVGQKYGKVWHKRKGSKPKSYVTPLRYLVSKIRFDFFRKSQYQHLMNHLILLSIYVENMHISENNGSRI